MRAVEEHRYSDHCQTVNIPVCKSYMEKRTESNPPTDVMEGRDPATDGVHELQRVTHSTHGGRPRQTAAR